MSASTRAPAHMVGALAYLTVAAARNRVRQQLRRARSPRTILGVLAGGAYVWYFLIRPAHEGGAAAVLTEPWTERIFALAMLWFVGSWWLTGADARALAFTPAEVHLLFPAPLTRRHLVAYKLLRAQLVILANVLIWTVVLRGDGLSLASWRRALALWLLFSVLHLHRMAAALLTAAPPADARAATGWRDVVRRVVPPVVLAGLALALLAPAVQAAPRLGAAWDAGLVPFGRALGGVLETPSASAALWPVRALLAPGFAPDGATWSITLVPAVLLLALHFVWVLGIDVQVHEAALVAAERRATRRATRRTARRARRRGLPGADGAADAGVVAGDDAPGPATARWSPPLAPRGAPAMAIVWKNAVAALRATALARTLLLFGVLAAGMLVLALRNPRLAELVAVVLGVWTAMAFVAGPRWVRFDLRQDLQHLAILRAWPLRGRDVVAAEVLASTAALTLAQLALVLLLFLASLGGRHALGFSLMERVAAVLATALALPGVNLAALTVQNGAALLFPGWVRPQQGPRGVEAMGQNVLATGFALLLLVLLLVVPGAAAGAVAWGAWRALGPWALLPAGAVLSALAWLEMRPVHAWLGRVFDRTDPTALGGAR